jgi:hypothetical protein
MNDLPAEWNLHYEAWIIGDGEPNRSVGEVFEWFTLEFWSKAGLANSTERFKSATPLPDFEYRVCAEVLYIDEEYCAVDFGLVAGGYRTNLPSACKSGDFVSGTIGIGLPAIALCPDEFLKNYHWRVKKIFAELTPYSEGGMLDRSQPKYQQTDSTMSLITHTYYVLHCSEVR